MQEVRVHLGKRGVIMVPREYQKLLGLKQGDELILKIDSGELRVIPIKQAIRRAQSLVRQYIPANRQLVQELINDRRQEANHE